MKKKFFIIFLLMIFFCGCQSRNEVIKKADGKSKTYQMFKAFNVNSYYVSFWDRNSSINDDTKIILARLDDKYYYEIDGTVKQKIIQKDGFKYTVDVNANSYFKKESIIEDYSLGILPNDINKLKNMGYVKGEEKIFDNSYEFEKYDFDGREVTYFYKNSKLIYIKYKNFLREGILKFNFIKTKFDEKIFDIDNKYEELTY